MDPASNELRNPHDHGRCGDAIGTNRTERARRELTQHLPEYAPLWYVVHGFQLVPLSDRVIADLAFWNGLRVASEPFEPLICQRPKLSVGLIAVGLPPDSAIAISAAMRAAAGLPPSCSPICSTPEPLYM